MDATDFILALLVFLVVVMAYGAVLWVGFRVWCWLRGKREDVDIEGHVPMKR